MWADGLEGCGRMLAVRAMGSITFQMRWLCTIASQTCFEGHAKALLFRIELIIPNGTARSKYLLGSKKSVFHVTFRSILA